MTTEVRPLQRDGAVDALRALALLPVIAVNWVGYASLPDAGPLGAAQPADSAAAQGALFLVASLLAGKGIALLSFLFGYSQALSRRARGAAAQAIRRRRMGRLLMLGLLQGVLIYSGEILTTYAVCGLLMLGLAWADLRLASIKRRMVLLLAVAMALDLLTALSFTFMSADFRGTELKRSLAAPSHIVDWLSLNAGSFFLAQLGALTLGLPWMLGAMAAGLLAGRLRLFSHRRWRPSLAAAARRWLCPGLALNLAWGFGLCVALQAHDTRHELIHLAVYLLCAAVLLLGLVPGFVLAAQRGAGWARVLAPAGRHTLSMYVGSSVLSLMVFSGAGFAWQPGTVVLALLSVTYWVLWLLAAQRLRARKLPLEAWLGR